MKTYLRAFINYEQNDWAKLLLIAEFAYNNAKNASTGHTLFELNYGYYLYICYEKDIDYRSNSKSANEFLMEFWQLMTVCGENRHHIQELQKWVYDKDVKSRSNAFSNKVWLNSKYIKTKQNRKLKAKLFTLFWVLHLRDKQAYKLELPKKWRIHNVFHMSLLEYDTI